MIDTTQMVLDMLIKQGNPNAKKLSILMERDIPIEGYQANLMYLQRGYGKSFMSYCMAAAEAWSFLQTNDKYEIRYFNDPDATTIRRKQEWKELFNRFMDEYFPDLEVDRHNSGRVTVLKKRTSNG